MLGEKILGGEKKMSKRIEKIEVSEVEKEVMRRQLVYFRKTSECLLTKERLDKLPFPYSRRLFCQENEDYLPCEFFGRQLVLKIVDELLD